MIVDRCDKDAKKPDLEFKLLGNEVHCMTQNPFVQSEVAIGSKNNLL
jgi:hypothetical protein